MRDDFSVKTKDVLAKRVGFFCSNPKCRKQTCGAGDKPNKIINIGVASHITAAAPGGPRYDSKLTIEERKSHENGIWLCQNCAKLIDDEPLSYNIQLLEGWKKEAEMHARNLMETNTNYSTDYNWQFSLSQQLTTFSRVPFQVPSLVISKAKASSEELFHEANFIVFRMLACAYLEASSLTKKSEIVFGLTLRFELEDNDIIHIWGEMVTHLTSFAYRFGVLANLLEAANFDELFASMRKFPTIPIRRQFTFGTLIPYKISRTNPAEISVQQELKKVYTFKGDINTSQLMYYLCGGANGSLVVFDDQNDVQGLQKLSRLMEETVDGFDFSEIWINPNNPEDWAFN